jgi:hypothetical protein
MGLSAFESRKYVLAATHLQGALDERRNALTPAQRSEAERVLSRARAFVARFELAVEPAGAEVTIDGTPAATDAGGQVLLDPGDHEVVAVAAGYETARSRITAEGGRTGKIVLELRPDAPPAAAPIVEIERAGEAPAAATQAPAESTTPTGLKVLTFAGFGVAGAGLIAGAVTGILSWTKTDGLKEDCDRDLCTTDRRSDIDDADTLAVASNVSFAVAGAGLAAGLVGLVLWTSRDGESPPPAAGAAASGASLTAFVAPDRVGVSGRF